MTVRDGLSVTCHSARVDSTPLQLSVVSGQWPESAVWALKMPHSPLGAEVRIEVDVPNPRRRPRPRRCLRRGRSQGPGLSPNPSQSLTLFPVPRTGEKCASRDARVVDKTDDALGLPASRRPSLIRKSARAGTHALGTRPTMPWDRRRLAGPYPQGRSSFRAELNQTDIRLLIVLKVRMAPEAPATSLIKENRELVRMLSASIRTAQVKGSQRTDDK